MRHAIIIISLASTAAMLTAARAVSAPSVTLKNAADPNVLMPFSGAGSGGYTGNATTYGAYPECWNGCYDPGCLMPDPPSFRSCGDWVEAALATYIQLGGRRIDSSDSYHSQMYAGAALSASGLSRADVFFTSKVGPYLALGGAEVTSQFEGILKGTGSWLTGFVDLLLIHWPSCIASDGGSNCPAPFGNSSTPVCQVGTPAYDERECRLDTWRALVVIWRSKGSRAIGVSNYNSTHLQEIKDAGLPLPAVNQIPFNIYHSHYAVETIAWCNANGVLVNGYSPFGVPDHKTFSPPQARTVFDDPIVQAIAGAHATTPDVVLLAWHFQQNIIFNPRSMNAAHMINNIGFDSVNNWSNLGLTSAEMSQLSSRPQA
jgi:diketogulonate reductase-like aldo/keto reductase